MIFAFNALKEMELFARRPINRSKRASHCNNDRLQLGFVVKEQVVLRQMLVCYESILTGESRAFLPDTIYARSSNGRKKHLPGRSLTSTAKGCDEKSQGSDCGS